MANTTGQVMPDGSVQYYEDAMGRAMISSEYDPTSSYAVGDYCMYNDERYCCNTAIASGGETWNSAHWDVAKVDDDITEIKSSLSNLGGDGYTAPPSGSYATNVSYGAGGYCRVGKIIIINLRIALSQNISANTALVSNLPVPNASANIVSVMNNRKADITLGTSGQIATADGLNAGNVILSCAYITT